MFSPLVLLEVFTASLCFDGFDFVVWCFDEYCHYGGEYQQCRSAIIGDGKGLVLDVHYSGEFCQHKAANAPGGKYKSVIHSKVLQAVKIFSDGWEKREVGPVVCPD